MTGRMGFSFPQVGDVVGHRFHVNECIGEGAHALVFAVTNVLTSKVLALKFPKRPVFDIVLHEARAASSASHPALIDVYDVGEERGAFFIILEYFPSPTLQQHLSRAPLGSSTLDTVFGMLTDAVSALHQKGVAHCDLKPSNILLQVGRHGDCRLKLIDFGSARFLTGKQISPRVRHHGSEPYLAPEQLDGASEEIDHRADIYALGIMLKKLWSAGGLEAEDPERYRRLRDAWSRAVSSDPRARFQSVAALAEAVRSSRVHAFPQRDRISSSFFPRYVSERATPVCLEQ